MTGTLVLIRNGALVDLGVVRYSDDVFFRYNTWVYIAGAAWGAGK